MTSRSIVTLDIRPTQAPFDLARVTRRRPAPGVVVLAVVAASLTWAAVAPHAVRAADSRDPAKAEELIREANDLRRRGRDGQALPLYRKAYEIARSARTAGQLGLAEMSLGYWTAAEGHLEEALAEGRNPWVEKTRPVLEHAQQVTQSHLGELRVEGQPAGAEVVINGAVVGTLPLQGPLRLNEGRFTLEVRAPGRRPMTTTLTLAGRGTERVQVALDREEKVDTGLAATPSRTMLVAPATTANAADGNAASATAKGRPGAGRDAPRVMEPPTGEPSRADEDEVPTWRRVLAWSLLGGAVVAGAIGAWQHVGSRDARESFDKIPACGASLPNRGGGQCQIYYDDFDSMRTHAYVGYGVAGALAAGAITMFIVNAASGPSGNTASAAVPSGSRAFVGPLPGGALMSYAARF
jgi:hypothetical protein